MSRIRISRRSPLLIAVFCLMPTVVRAQADKTQELVVTAETAQVKLGTTVLGTVKRGTRFPLGEVQGEWYRVAIDQNGKRKSGWIHRAQLKVEVSGRSTNGTGKKSTGLTGAQTSQLIEKNFVELVETANKLQKAGRSEEAERITQEVVTVLADVVGKNHQTTAQWRYKLARFQHARGDYTTARSNYEKALNTYRDISGEQNQNTAIVASSLGLLLKETGDWSSALQYDERALAVWKELLGENHRHTATAMNNLGALLYEMGDYRKARPYLERALDVRRDTLGDHHPDTAGTLNNLGLLLKSSGDFTAARDLLEDALQICRRELGDEHANTASSMNSLGLLLRDMGDVSTARPLLEESLRIRRKISGKQHPDTATALNNLALLLRDLGENEEARQHFDEALEIRATVFGQRHPSTARAMSHAGVLLSEAGDFAAARSHLEEAVRIHRAVSGDEHPDTAAALNSLSLLFDQTGDYSKAVRMQEQVLSVRRKSLGSNHPVTATSWGNLGVMLESARNTVAAVEAFEHVGQILRRNTGRVLPGLSQAEQLTFLAHTYEDWFHTALSLGPENRSDAKVASFSAGWLLNGKAVAHEALAQRRLLARESTDPAAAEVLEELKSVRSQLARQSLKVVSPKQREIHRRRLAELEAEADRLTRRLGQLGLDAELPDPWVELDEVRNRIPAGAVLIDIARFRPYDFENRVRQPAGYAAWIIPATNAGDIRIVDLGEAEAVEAAVATVRTALEQAPQQIRTNGEPVAEQALRQPLQKLSDMILRPLLAQTGKAQQLILSPDALLWLVPWGALPVGEDRYAIEDYELSFVVSGRDLVTKRKPFRSQPPLIVADPDFGPAPSNQANSQRSGSSLATLPSVQRLPGTAAEARAIRPRIEQYAGQTPELRTGDDASESAFRAIRRPEVLTLSTHGFFLPDQEVKQSDDRLAMADDTRSVALTTEGKPLENPLLRCGLLLAGCNQRSETKADEDDGVLTGLEIVGTDLRGTKLVVLSACETGLGDVRNGEGVAGLRQAFQLAGAESVVATLWQVPDRDTARLMVDFFDQLAEGKSRSEALRNAQLARIRSHRQRYGAAHPFFWAAVTLTGEWK